MVAAGRCRTLFGGRRNPPPDQCVPRRYLNERVIDLGNVEVESGAVPEEPLPRKIAERQTADPNTHHLFNCTLRSAVCSALCELTRQATPASSLLDSRAG